MTEKNVRYIVGAIVFCIIWIGLGVLLQSYHTPLSPIPFPYILLSGYVIGEFAHFVRLLINGDIQ